MVHSIIYSKKLYSQLYLHVLLFVIEIIAIESSFYAPKKQHKKNNYHRLELHPIPFKTGAKCEFPLEFCHTQSISPKVNRYVRKETMGHNADEEIETEEHK